MSYLIVFALGCILTYLITVITSFMKASIILQEASLTFAFLIMAGYETNAEQIEFVIANNKMSDRDAFEFRKKSNKTFEEYVNRKIDIINKNIPPSHHNIIKFKDFNELKLYVINTALKHKRRK